MVIAMRYGLLESQRDAILLLARVLLMLLFLLSGWSKLPGFAGTVGYMASLGAPLPWLAAAIAVLMEVFVAIAILLGFYTRPLAFLFALFVLGTALLGHAFWNMEGAARSEEHTSELQSRENLVCRLL